ncbi:metal ABC transporter solute-binding protein, Zn/Mn family [Clostridium algidicarnis]|uniref:metal ABC transporter solute-binding protein, Zn/Mn family n=1 Tax=Clostridium algidicarnis TaxID=37659 RepID=UPI001C0C4D64|nr:zinc ABC transporter substrate-binding protein [Clostridium algidicarnis]MBU3228141.1 zinc ABC transporter substrate-binding protein [Clostridium algidicarnis]MBU3252025.1 zinc ABC transporter substrate-binding protein [Clostridium algidicarnis]
MKKVLSSILVLSIIAIFISGCAPAKGDNNSGGKKEKYNVVTTTTMLSDMTKSIGGDYVEVKGLMGPGVDPHLYKASAGDVSLMQKADMVVYNGLHLEGKMGEVFEKLDGGGKLIVSVADGVKEEDLLKSQDASISHDPHIWFDVNIWKDASKELAKGLKELDKEHEKEYDENLKSYLAELDELDEYIKKRTSELQEENRVLITAHDAFNYFGKAYGYDVRGLQGISTASEAGTSDVRELANFIVERKIKAVFIESSVPKKNIEALQEAVKAQGFDVKIGGELYSDSIGDAGSKAETYIGTFKSNIDTIVDALK